MNKKFLVFAILGVLTIGLVSAITYYAVFSASFSVLSSISIDGNTEQSLGEVYSGETIIGDPITITNNAPSEREVSISDDSDEDVDVSYVSNLALTQKVVDFGSSGWTPTGDVANVRYTIVGDEFSAEITDGVKEGYVLVYYKDNSDRFNSPAEAIGIDSVSGNLPYGDDANSEEYNYCELENYTSCYGAKLWYIPSDAIDVSGNVDWSRAEEFLFETNVIQYNLEGNIVIYPGSSLIIFPVYDISDTASGEYTITTTIA